MKVAAQGMRRSGTTAVYDAFVETGVFACSYEPLAACKPGIGGGSGIRQTDPFESVREARKQFLQENPEILHQCPYFESANLLNYGAPRNPALEFEPDAPRYVWDYLSHVFDSNPNSFVKFTRMHSKIYPLSRELSDGYLIHIVRDPRSVACSYLFGKNQRNRHRFTDEDHFFTRSSDMSAWSSRPFSDYLLSIQNPYGDRSPTDLQRILMIWKYKFETTHEHGSKAFKDRYILLCYEEFASQPVAVMGGLMEQFGFPLSTKARVWLDENIRAPGLPFASGDKRWQKEFEALDMSDCLTSLTYL